MVKLIVLGSASTFPYPRTKVNRFSDYLNTSGYEKKFELHDDIICNLAKKGGKERRLRSCLAVVAENGTILIDAGPDIVYQLARYKVNPDVILITHEHADANFGLKYLPGIKVMAEGRGNLRVGKKLNLFGLGVTPFRVNHAKNAVSVGYRMELKNSVIVYLGDTANLDGVKKWVQGSDVVFADGSVLDRNMPSHLSIVDQLKLFSKWRVKKVIFTHIGHKTLPHNDLQRYCRSIYKPTDIAYDGQNFKI